MTTGHISNFSWCQEVRSQQRSRFSVKQTNVTFLEEYGAYIEDMMEKKSYGAD